MVRILSIWLILLSSVFAKDYKAWKGESHEFITQEGVATSTPLFVSTQEVSVSASSSVSLRNNIPIRYYEDSSNGSNYVDFKFASSIMSNQTVTLGGDCAVGEILKRQASGIFECSADDNTGGGASGSTFYSATTSLTLESVPAVVSASVDADITITLPDASANSGAIVDFSVLANSATNTITIDTTGSQTIGMYGATTTKMSLPGSALRLFSNGAGWESAGSSGRVFIAKDQKTSGTGGGSCSTGWASRTLNTTSGDESVASIVSDEVVVGPGKYKVKFSAPGQRSNSFKVRLRDKTNGVSLAAGSSQFADTGLSVNFYSVGTAVFSATGTWTVAIQQECQTVNTDSHGAPSPSVTGDEVYAQIEVEKLGE